MNLNIHGGEGDWRRERNRMSFSRKIKRYFAILDSLYLNKKVDSRHWIH